MEHQYKKLLLRLRKERPLTKGNRLIGVRT